MADRYLNQTKAALIYGCKRQAIREAMQKGKALHAAVVFNKKTKRDEIDMKHPAAVAYRREYRTDLGEVEEEESTPEIDAAATLPPEIRKAMDMTLRDVIDRYGMIDAFAKLLTAAEKIENIHAKRLDSDKKTGELTSRKFVEDHMFGLVEQVFQRLLTDLPATLSYKVHGQCSTGAAVETIQETIRAGVTVELRNIKTDMKKLLKKAK